MNAIQSAAAEQFSRQSRQYGERHILADVSDVRAALAQINLPGHSRVLDVACGAGHTGLCLAELGHAVTLADISTQMLERVSEAAAKRGLRVETRCHPAEQLPYPDATFDLVTCRVAAHHFSSVESFVREVARVLKPAAHFVLIDGSIEDNHREAEEWLHQVEQLRDPSHVRFLPPSRWRELCQNAGLCVRSIGLHPKKQPDLAWYFETAATSPENRARVLELIENAPPQARSLLRLCIEDGKIAWWWQIVTLIAQVPSPLSPPGERADENAAACALAG